MNDYIDWQKSQHQNKMGNLNMQYAKSKTAVGAAEIFHEDELKKVENETGMQKRD
jgi:hypothetical protein